VHIGVNAVYIVGAMSFIIGLVLALQSAAQLRNFGANIFIVDLTVIAMMREMGPLITAILVAGRSGSSIAAEVATMKVTSELDALKTMALNPIRFVIIPKMYGSFVTMPFLTIIADVLGILGGMLIAYFYLDITPVVFINRMGESLYNRDILIGIFKSLIFAGLIVLTGSFFGLRVTEGAEGVGKVTTLAVVVAIALVIVADSILGLIFY
jgi:phospholipid/cholesterol/gamma-HCH transport system permease protein